MNVCIFDSNIWVLAFTKSKKTAVQLRNDVKQGNKQVKVDAYIYQEVLNAFDRSHSNQAGTLKTAFAQFVGNCKHVRCPNQQAVSSMKCKKIRNKPEMELIGNLLNIQPKDAPIVVVAQYYSRKKPTIYTHDRPFGQLSPSQHGLKWLSVDYVT